MALIKEFTTQAGTKVSYWRVISEERNYNGGGLSLDVMVGGYLDAATYASGAAPAQLHRFQLSRESAQNTDPKRADVYGVLKAVDPFFAGAEDDLETRTPPPAPKKVEHGIGRRSLGDM